MIYPDTFEDKIGFSVVRTMVSDLCISNMGKENVISMTCHTDFDEISLLLKQTDQFQYLLLFDDPFPAQDFYDIREILAQIRLEGQFLEIEELAEVRAFIQAIIQAVVYFRIKNEEDKYPDLWNLCKDIILEKKLLESINGIINPKGQLRDQASDELRRIKHEIIKVSAEADKKIKKLLRNAKQDGLVKEDAEMTIRNGRLCIPVPAQFKRRLSGFIHDESATGQTVFIEPAEVFDANNELKNYLLAERREIIRILTEISNEIRLSIPNLKTGIQFLGQIDFIRAKALWAVKIKAVMPHIFPYPVINWQKAIHPLLFLNFQNTAKKVQPLNILLNKEKRILIISGPNAGGKSVCLKTVGLLQFMMQCGLLVPMDGVSDMGIFNSFFIDIGDEQSIDNDLSTYSSHLHNLKIMMERLDRFSLFLIDEFGSGTEPSLGGAMAEAILEYIYAKQSFGIITTHYGNLKMFCDRFPEAENGAMLFDTQALKPLFILKQGKPGSSFTYEIAKQIGLSTEIIDNAISKSGTAQIDYERKLEEIELEKLELDKMLRMVTQTDDKLAELLSNYNEKFNEFEKQRKNILQAANNQAISIIESANQAIEKTIREIKEAKADPHRTKEIRREVATFKEKLQKEDISTKEEPALTPFIPISPTSNTNKTPVDNSSITIGSAVFIADIETVGEVTKLSGNDVTVSFNSISFKTTLSKLTKISKKEARQISRTGITRLDGTRLGDVMNEKIAKFKTEIDLRGKRANEAIQLLESYIDEAILLGVKQVNILHGKGNGILRHVIRQWLSKRKEVAHYYDDAIERGGCGITIVEMS